MLSELSLPDPATYRTVYRITNHRDYVRYMPLYEIKVGVSGERYNKAGVNKRQLLVYCTTDKEHAEEFGEELQRALNLARRVLGLSCQPRSLSYRHVA